MDLFIQSVTSVHERVQGFQPKTIYHYDDSSCEEERAEMQYLLRHLFKPKRMISRFYDKYDFKDGYRHSRIMQDWKYDMANANSRYVLHTEDDWMFVEDVNINLALQHFKNKKTAMLGFAEPFRKFPENLTGLIEQKEDTWKWHFSSEHLLLEPMFVDEVASEILYDKAPTMWQNKPSFNLKPAIFDNAKLLRMKNFEAIPRINGMIVPFKLEFGLRYEKMFDSWFYKKCHCINLGNEQSAYTLNRSNK